MIDAEQLRRDMAEQGALTLHVPASYTPHPMGLAAHRASAYLRRRGRARFLCANAGRRGGKTVLGSAEFGVRALADFRECLSRSGRFASPTFPRGAGTRKDPLLRYAVVSPTYALTDQPKINLRRRLGAWVEHEAGNTMWLHGGIRIDFLTADRPERLVSQGYHGVWMDEAARCKPEVWRDNLQPTLSDTLGWAIFTSTPLGRNWFWQDCWRRGDPLEAGDEPHLVSPDWLCVRWYTADNTAVPHLAAEAEDARQRMPEAMWRRNYAADFNAFVGQCFPFLDRAVHYEPASVHPSAIKRAWLGIDWGWRHPSVLTVWGVDTLGRIHECETVSMTETPVDSDDAWRHQSPTVLTVIAAQMFRRWNCVHAYAGRDKPGDIRAMNNRGIPTSGAYLDRADGLLSHLGQADG